MAATKTTEAQVVLTLSDRLTAGLNRIQARLTAMASRLQIGRLTSSFGNLGSKIAGLGPALSASTARLGLFTAALGFGGAGAIAATTGLANRAQALGDEIAKTSRQLGIGAEALQEWRYTSEMQGVTVETLEQSLGVFNRRIGEASTGNKAFAQSFADIGVSVKDSQGNIKDMDTLLMEVTAALEKVESPSQRAAIAMDLFGRSGMDMTRIFEAGVDGIVTLREEARATGHVMSTAAAEFSEVYGDNVARLQRRFEGLQTMIGVQLMPVLNDLVLQAMEWYDANQALIRSTITEWVGKLAELLKQLADPTSELRVGFADLVDKVTGFYNAISPLIDFIGGPGIAALTALGLYIAGPLIAAFAALLPAIWAVGVALLTTPIGWIIMGIVALGVAIKALIDNWDAVVAAWNGAWTAIGEGVAQFGADMAAEWNDIAARFAEVGAEVAEWFTVDLYGVGVAIVESLKNGLLAAWEGVVSTITTKIAELTSMLPDWVKGPLGIEVAPRILNPDELDAAARAAADAAAGQVQGGGFLGMGQSETYNAERQAAYDAAYAAERSRLESQNASLAAGQSGLSPAPLATPSAIPEVQTTEVQAGTMQVQSANFPEPIVANQPQVVNAPLNVGGITVNVQGMTPAEGQAMVSRALRQEEARRAANVTSALND